MCRESDRYGSVRLRTFVEEQRSWAGFGYTLVLDARLMPNVALGRTVWPMTRSRSFTGTVTTAVLVVAFGNQWVSDWIRDHFKSDNVLSYLIHQLTSPSWSLKFSGSDSALRTVVATDLKAVLTIVFVYVLLVTFRNTFPEGFAGFILGWSTLIFASALAALVSAFVAPSATVLGALNAAAIASVYGLFVGWVVGFTTSVGRNIKLFQSSKTAEV